MATESNLLAMTQYDFTNNLSREDQIKSINLYSKFMTRSKRFGDYQFNFLVFGVILYIFWSILEMYIRTIK